LGYFPWRAPFLRFAKSYSLKIILVNIQKMSGSGNAGKAGFGDNKGLNFV